MCVKTTLLYLATDVKLVCNEWTIHDDTSRSYSDDKSASTIACIVSGRVTELSFVLKSNCTFCVACTVSKQYEFVLGNS